MKLGCADDTGGAKTGQWRRALMGNPRRAMTIHYAAVNKGGMWHEVGDRILTGKEPVCIFEKNLKRVRTGTGLRPARSASSETPDANTSADAQESDLTGAI
jgi:hypothetical protein